MNFDQSIQLEIKARKPMGGDVLHPDQCMSLVIGGVEWHIPPRRGSENSVTFAPVFSDKKTGVNVTAQSEDDLGELPEAKRFAELTDQPNVEICKTCEQPIRAELSFNDKADLVPATFALIKVLLLKQYELTDAQLISILTGDQDKISLLVAQLYEWGA